MIDQENTSEMALESARTWLEVFNQGDWEKFRAQLHPEVVFTQRTIGRVNQGVQDVFSSFYNWRADHTELYGHTTDGFGSSVRAALEVHWTGMKVDGEAVDFYACLLFRAQDGELIEIIDYY